GAPAGTASPVPPLEDLILSAKEVEEKALKTRSLLEVLARRDPAFSPRDLEASVTATFLQTQRGWEQRDYGPVRDRLMPSLLEEHEALLRAMRRDRLVCRMENLSVSRLEFVYLYCPDNRDLQEVTALITFQTRAYYVHEASGEYVHGDLRVVPY